MPDFELWTLRLIIHYFAKISPIVIIEKGKLNIYYLTKNFLTKKKMEKKNSNISGFKKTPRAKK